MLHPGVNLFLNILSDVVESSLVLRFTSASVFLPYRAEFSMCTCSYTVGKRKVPFSMAIGNGELMHECFRKELSHGNSKNEIR